MYCFLIIKYWLVDYLRNIFVIMGKTFGDLYSDYEKCEFSHIIVFIFNICDIFLNECG